MSTYEMMKKSIEVKKARGAITESYIQSTMVKLDVFLANDRINADEYSELVALLNS